MGWCAICGTPDPRSHVNDCPWPRLRQILDRDTRDKFRRGIRTCDLPAFKE